VTERGGRSPARRQKIESRDTGWLVCARVAR